MGGNCSKKSSGNKKKRSNPYANTDANAVDSYYNKPQISNNQHVKESKEKQQELQQETNLKQQIKEQILYAKTDTGDEFYDGIPRYSSSSIKSRSVRRQAAVAKVSEVSSRLSRAGTLGLGKAVEVLDTLGSSMINLNLNSGFASGVASKGNELGIVAFEVANTIVKGSNLMQSLSARSVRHLKEVVLPSEGVQNLISKDMDELLRIIASDKREELKIFSGEVVRFGNRCKDPQWHNLDRYFEKISRKHTPRRQLQEAVESEIELLAILVQYTAELYHELLVLDRIEQECQRREDKRFTNQKGPSLAALKAELKSQRKRIQHIKKKSLWSRSLEEVMEKLVDIVHFLILEIDNAFGSVDEFEQAEESASKHTRLGPAGLSLHYANVVMQIDNIVGQPSPLSPNSRESLYQCLPPAVKSALRSKLQSFQVKEEMTIAEIKDEMEKTLSWLVPLSTNTAKAHHGFGWVGEWASNGSEANRKPATGPIDIIQIDTLHHAHKEKTEAYILELLLWLNHLISKTKCVPDVGATKSLIKSPVGTLEQKSDQKQKQELPYAYESSNAIVFSSSPSLVREDQTILQGASKEEQMPGNRQSQDADSEKAKMTKHDKPSKSSTHSPPRESKDSATIQTVPSVLPITDIGIDKEKTMDVVDGVDLLGYKGKQGLVTA